MHYYVMCHLLMISLVDSEDSFLFRCNFFSPSIFPPKLMNGTQGLACFVLMSIPLPLNLAPDCAKPVTMAPFSYPARDSLQGLLLGKESSFGDGQTRKEQPHYHLEKRVPRTRIMHDKQFSKHRRAVSCFFSLDLPPTSHLPLFSCSD